MEIKVNCFLGIVLTGLLSIMSYGCAKDDLYQDNQLSQEAFASLAIVNAVPTSLRMEAFLHEKKFNTSAEKLSYGDKTAYRNVYSGNQTLSVSNYTSSGSEIVTKELNLQTGKIYSVFVFKDKSLQTIQSEDFIVKPANNKAKLRIVNLSPDVKPLDIQVSSGVDFTQVGFKAITAFEEIEVTKTIRVTIGNTSQQVNIVNDFTPLNQEIYTLLIQGFVNPTTESERIRAVMLKQ